MGYSTFDGMSGLMFGIIPVIVVIGFIFVFGTIIVRSVQGVHQWKKNNDSPVLTVDAAVVAKRADVSHYHHDSGVDNVQHSTSSTTYYVTFEVASGDRIEFSVSGKEYGMVADEDNGKLTFQGTRYLGFERIRQ